MRSDQERLLDILEAIDRIEKYAAQGKKAFEGDELIQNWMVHHLQIIGEAAARLSTGFRSQNATVQWSEIIGMRNVLVHEYFGVDTEIVWAAVESQLPQLRRDIAQMVSEAP